MPCGNSVAISPPAVRNRREPSSLFACPTKNFTIDKPSGMITINDNCIHLIKSFEGLMLKPYHCAADRPDVFTIGYGTIKYPPYFRRGKIVALTDSAITEAQAENFLHYEVTQK